MGADREGQNASDVFRLAKRSSGGVQVFVEWIGGRFAPTRM
jgi:hypothetical protein